MSKSREQRVAESIAQSNRRSFEPVVKKVQLSNEYLARKVCPDIEAAVRACEIEPAAPSLHDLRSDLDRVTEALETAYGLRHVSAAPAVVRQLSPLARQAEWQLTAFVRASYRRRCLRWIEGSERSA